MDNKKYIGMDVHQASISIAVSDAAGKVLMECIIETKAATVLEFIQGLRGSLWVTFEEGTSAAWLYDLLKPHVTKVVVCDPRRNALLKAGNKNDRVDARKLSDLLRAGLLTPVYHGESGVRTLRELSRLSPSPRGLPYGGRSATEGERCSGTGDGVEADVEVAKTQTTGTGLVASKRLDERITQSRQAVRSAPALWTPRAPHSGRKLLL